MRLTTFSVQLHIYATCRIANRPLFQRPVLVFHLLSLHFLTLLKDNSMPLF